MGAGHCPAEPPVGVGAGTYWQWAEATLGSPGRAAEPGMPSRSLVHTIVIGERPGGTLAVGPFVGVGAGTYWQWAEATLGSPGRAAEPGMPSRSLVHTIVIGERPGGVL